MIIEWRIHIIGNMYLTFNIYEFIIMLFRDEMVEREHEAKLVHK